MLSRNAEPLPAVGFGQPGASIVTLSAIDRSSAISRRFPAISHRPSAVGHIGHQPFASRHRSSTISVIRHVGRRPPTVRPYAVSHRPSAVGGKPGHCENRLLAICSPDAPVRTGTCPGIVESGTVLKRSKGEVHSHLRKPYSQRFFLESQKRIKRPRESTIWHSEVPFVYWS